MGYKLPEMISEMNSSNRNFSKLNFTSKMPMPPEDSFLPPPLPDRIIICLIVCYSLIILLSVLFNMVVIVVIAGSRGKRSVTDMFILSLAASDLMVSTINMPFQLYYYVVNVWNIGVLLCKLSKYLQAVTIVSTVMTLTAIAIDRFVAICNPLGARKFHTRRSAVYALLAVWLLSLVAVSPQLVVQRLDIRIVRDETFNIAFICAEFFPRGERDDYLYSIIIFVVLYTIPLLAMFLCYGAIAHRLWIRKPIGDILANPQGYGRQINQRKKIIKMLITIVLAFTILWFPFFTVSLYYDLQLHQNDVSYRTVMAILQLVGYSNSCINPIIYTFLNNKFQRDFMVMCSSKPNRLCVCCIGQNITIKQTLTPVVATTSVTI